MDAFILHALIRDLKPKRIIEIGSGFSTMIAGDALRKNEEDGAEPCHFTAIEPYPNPSVRAGIDGVTELVEKKVQDVPVERFEELGPNDILFIDSSHVLKVGSDVYYEFLEILPRIQSGVYVHVHDIFLPWDYPRSWIVDKQRFWNEQYLLQAFLACNTDFEVLWGSAFMRRRHPDAVAKCFDTFPPKWWNDEMDPAARGGASFWIQRVRD